MYAGNIGAAQDFPTVLAAAERLKDLGDLKFVFVGDGRMADWVAAEVARRGLSGSVVMLGQHPVESMPRFFAAADAMLVTLRPDPVFALTIPAKVQAYLASGRPIVAALDGEGAAVVRESGAGIACPAGDAEALAAAVRAMRALSEDERAAMGRRAAAYSAAEFDRDILLDRLEEWLREAAHGRP
jgi:glycosyltransferase involved in cell wall biosynthesis